MSKAEQIVMAEFGEKIQKIFENYETWANADEHKTEIYEEIANLASETCVTMN